MTVPFLFAVPTVAPLVQAPAPVLVSSVQPAVGSHAFAGLLERMIDAAPVQETVTPSEEPASPGSPAPSALEWAVASLMAAPVKPQIVVGAETATEAVEPPTMTRIAPATVEQAIAAAVAPAGIDAGDVTVESLLFEEDAVDVPAPTPAPSAPPTEVAAPTPTDSIARIERSLERLEPRFRARVERVVSRARKELGLHVVVRETVRSQDRQDALYAQGRTQPGEIVTWTKRSLHTVGLAADLEIVADKSAPKAGTSEIAYARLAMLANEEGLNTLGPRDPGHVEFRGGRALPQTVFPRRNDPGLIPLGKPAPVARPATIVPPQPADPAPVATVIAPPPGEGKGSESAAYPNMAEPVPVPALPLAPVDLPETITPSSNIAARIDQVQTVADVVADRPVSGVVLRLDGDAGDGDRIRIDVRRNVVETSVRTADAALTQRIVSESPTLQAALERHGLEVGRIEVRSQAAIATDAQPRGFENNRDRESPAESYRRNTQQEPRQRQRRQHNQHGGSQR